MLLMLLIEVLFALIKLKLLANVLFADMTNDAIFEALALINPSSDVNVMFILATEVFKVVKFPVCVLTVFCNAV